MRGRYRKRVHVTVTLVRLAEVQVRSTTTDEFLVASTDISNTRDSGLYMACVLAMLAVKLKVVVLDESEREVISACCREPLS
jgi:hypothetical protein